MSATIFTAVEMAPRDPILGLTEQFNADPNPAKVNLGVGVYFNDEGKLPVLRCVAEAEKQLLAAPKPKNYLPIDGIAAYDKAVQGLVFGADSDAVKGGRVATVQALGGTGGLKVGADFLKRLNPNATVLISDVFTAHPFIHYDKLVLAERPIVVSDVWFHQGTALFPTAKNPSLRLPASYSESNLIHLDWPAYQLADWHYVLIRTRPEGSPGPLPAALELDAHEGGWWLYRVNAVCVQGGPCAH